MIDSLSSFMTKSPDYDEINRVGDLIFKQGEFELLDEYMMLIAPLINKSYYKYIASLDDSNYAREDLIQDTFLALYKDMKLRWDKYINVRNYYTYISSICTNIMTNLVHEYHSYYQTTEYDPELVLTSYLDMNYERVDYQLAKESIFKNILVLVNKLASFRKSQCVLLKSIIRALYVDRAGLDKVKSRARVVYVNDQMFSFLVDHVKYLYKLAFEYHEALLKENGKVVDDLEIIFGRFSNVTYDILVDRYQYSILPEVYAEFGPELARRFVRSFSGRTVEVPNYQDFCDFLLSGTVMSMINGDKENLYKVAKDYKISYKSLRRIYNKTEKYYSKGVSKNGDTKST